MNFDELKYYYFAFGKRTIYKQTIITQPGHYRIYTDGSYKNELQIGSSAFLILRDGIAVAKGKENSDYKKSVVAELQAVLLALSEIPFGSRIEIHTDCEAVAIFFFRLHQFRSKEEMFSQYSDREVLPLIKKLDYFSKKHFIKFYITERKHPLIQWCHNCANDIEFIDTIEIDKNYMDEELFSEPLVYLKHLQTKSEPINNSMKVILNDLMIKKS